VNTVIVTFGDAPRRVLELSRIVEDALRCWGRYGTYELRGWLVSPTLTFSGLSEDAAFRLTLALETCFLPGTDHHVRLD
jgi:hypothetical protein